MSRIPVVENPRRKRRRSRRLTAKQMAAGFGGKRRMGGKRKSTRRRRRRNPALATLALGNPRRRRRRSVLARSPRRRRRYNNPSVAGIDLMSAAYVAGGMIGSKVIPGLVAKVWAGIPRVGIGGYAVKVGAVVAAGMAAGLVTKNSARRNQVVAGGMALILFELFNEFLAPKLGLYGLGSNDFVSTQELDEVLNGDLSGFVPSGTSYVDVPDEVLAA